MEAVANFEVLERARSGGNNRNAQLGKPESELRIEL
jgi:hypothetical protein